MKESKPQSQSQIKKMENLRRELKEAEKDGKEKNVLEIEDKIRELEKEIKKLEEGKKMRELIAKAKKAEKAKNGEELLRIEKEIKELEAKSTGKESKNKEEVMAPETPKKTRKLDPGEIEIGFNIDIDSEKIDVEKELEKLSPEDREKIGWGLNTFGFKIEKFKDDFFADNLDKSLSKIDKKGTTGRFCTELKNHFIKNSKDAVKKANDASAFSDTKIGMNIWGKKRGINISAGEQKTISNLGNFSGNVLKYGRLIFDATGITVGAANRVAMTVGMATTVLAEAGKEARLKNEDVIEKTRIGKEITRESSAEEVMQHLEDVARAQDEADKIYKRAQVREKTENVSTEALKKAYLMEMPKDLQERLKEPATANKFFQGLIKKDIKSGLFLLNLKIKGIENNSDLSDEQKEAEKEKLIDKQRKNLEDYDRIITQYGTIDMAAMALRYTQTAGKATVAALQVETLFIGVDKMCETISNIYHHFHAPSPTEPATTPTASPTPAPATPETLITSIPKTSPEINFINEGIKFEHGKGGIQGILDLKEQIRTQYNGNYSKAPENVRNFMNTDATKQAIKLGFFDPNNSDGKESARIMAGSILKFDEHGNLLFGKPDTSGNIPVLEKYHGTMFDSDHSASRNVGVAPKTTAQNIETYIDEETKKMDTEVKLKQQIEDHIDEETQKMNVEDVPAENPVEKPETPAPQNIPLKEELPPGTFRTGTSYGIGSKIGVGSEMPIGSGVHTGGDKAYVGDRIQVGSTAQIGGSYYGYEQGYFRDLSLQDNLFLEDHPEYSSNPFGLSGQELIQAHKISQKDMSYLFGNNAPSIWDKLSDLKAGKLMEQADPADNISDEGRMAQYLTLLRNFSDLSPKMGFWGGIGAENNEYYIARTMQKLIADGKLEKFEEILRK
ncbi:MAG: hypothetical protein ABIG99_01470 [Patescibacteria group bacterium]